MDKIKQVIVMRKDLNMRKGKMCAQAGHAVLGAAIKSQNSKYYKTWEETGQTKICVGVNSLEELFKIQKAGAEKGLYSYIVEDWGLTEFHGESNYTCLAFEPLPSIVIDEITGELKLL